jgi:predicted GNAT family acetyltransferase
VNKTERREKFPPFLFMAVTNNKEKSRYELETDGYLSIADYQLNGSELAITHVYVPDELRGRGIAAQVMAGVVEDATKNNLHIVPTCSYAAAYMKRHVL